MDTKNSTKTLVFAAMLAALTCISTMLFAVPVPGGAGYVNMGDCFVILSGLLIGGPYGVAAAGIGSGLADLFNGYTFYAPVTLLIKGLMALAVWLIFSKLQSKRPKAFAAWIVVAGVAAELIMILGYFLFEWVLYGIGTASFDILASSIQGAFGILTSAILGSVLYMINLKTHFMK